MGLKKICISSDVRKSSTASHASASSLTTPQHPPSPAAPQARAAERIDSTARVPRKRIAQLHPGVLAGMDAAVEARRDTEHVAVEHETRRADVQDLFAYHSRKLIRKLEGELRRIDRELRGERRAA